MLCMVQKTNDLQGRLLNVETIKKAVLSFGPGLNNSNEAFLPAVAGLLYCGNSIEHFKYSQVARYIIGGAFFGGIITETYR